MWWIIGAVLVAIILLDSWHDSRKLRIGVFSVFLASWLLFAVIGIITQISDDNDRALAWALLALIGLGLGSVLLLGVFSIANGVTMMRLERRSLAHILSLMFGLGLVGLVVYIGAVFVVGSIDPSAAFEMVRWLLFAALPIAYLSFVFLAFVFQSLVYGLVAPRVSRRANAVIVLGAGLKNGEVTDLLAARLDRGKKIFERLTDPESVLIVSGGQGADESHPESRAMADYLLERGTDPDRLWEETESTSTEENLILSAKLLAAEGRDQPRCLVVTNNYHVFRAALLMRKLEISGHAVGAKTAPHYWPSAFLREYLAILRDHKIMTGAALGVTCLPLLFMLVAKAADLLA